MHAVITDTEYRKLIGKTAGRAYLFFGEEDYMKNYAVQLTRENISPDPTFALFNDVTIDAVDFTIDGLLNAMSPPPMMADGRLILIRGLDFNVMKRDDMKPLYESLLEALALIPEYDYNTVIIQVAAGLIDEGTVKKPSAMLKQLSEVAVPVRFDPVTPARLCAWAIKHFAHHGVTASPELCQHLITVSGRDMFRLSGEIKKIAHHVLAHGRDALEKTDVDVLAAPEISMDTYALSNALLTRDYRAALDVLAVLKFERAKPFVVLGSISATLCDVYATRVAMDEGRTLAEITAAYFKNSEYRAKLAMRSASSTSMEQITRVIDLCAEADEKVKRSNTDSFEVLERLICSL